MICLSLLLISLLILDTCSQELSVPFVSNSDNWSLPHAEELWMIGDGQTLLQVVRDISSRNRTIVAAISRNITLDSYLVLYLGRFISWFENDQFNPSFVIFQKPPKLTWVETAVLMLSQLPPKAIFLSYQHGRSSFGISPLKEAKRMFNYTPTVVFHLNHERPWMNLENTDPTVETMDFTFNTTYELMEAYSEFPLVFRQYYYTALLPTSQYIPIGAPYYGHLIDNPGNQYYPLFQSLVARKASERDFFCAFRGRLKYASNFEKGYDPNLTSPYDVDDRILLASLYAQGKFEDCEFYEFEVLPGAYSNMVQPYEEYMMYIAQAAFVLCPNGNNPETFRLYEALEVGSIPIITRTKALNSNFLRCKVSSYLLLFF